MTYLWEVCELLGKENIEKVMWEAKSGRFSAHKQSTWLNIWAVMTQNQTWSMESIREEWKTIKTQRLTLRFKVFSVIGIANRVVK